MRRTSYFIGTHINRWRNGKWWTYWKDSSILTADYSNHSAPSAHPIINLPLHITLDYKNISLERRRWNPASEIKSGELYYPVFQMVVSSFYPSFIKPTISLSEKSEKIGIPSNQMDDVPFIKFIQIFICIIIFLCFFKIYLEIELYLKISFNQSVILRRKAACIVIWRGLNIFKKWFISFSKKII